jgi:[ribosomal protein S18]-alanine N-acetyltransferase
MNALLQPRQPVPTRRREMKAADVDAVAAIEATAYSYPWTRGNFIDSLAAGYHADVLLALGDFTASQPAPPLLGYFVAMTGVDELHLLNITIAPAWQGLGHGTALLDSVLVLAQRLGLGSLWLEVRQGNARAQALYQRYGFAEVGRRKNYYPAPGQREDAVVMSLNVRSPLTEPPRVLD